MSKVIIFPTDTVYGIGCDIFDLEGIERIYKIKNRSKDKPLACLCANLEQIEDIAYLSEDARKLINLFLPGPLTIILKSKPIVLDKIGYKTIGVRIPNNKIALDILNEHGPMLTTSVNESGNVPLNEYDDIKANYNHLVDYIYNTNTKSSNISSTVIDLTDDRLRILRIGEIPLSSIEKALNK
ncbi:MAG: threonylcarbamoyl-AMP synthase [Acholeplasmatales bacterium]|nr:threonylcarbamoyl-AMP synthase [Acholeplasmatales bacterium]